MKLQFAEHVEYVKNANMTSKDRYVVPLMMANKTVTKKCWHKPVFECRREKSSRRSKKLCAYPRFAKQGIVVKPKSTNYGLGISIFKDGVSEEDYETAVAIAFAEDRAILVEEFLPGTEYRFFVLDGKVQGIMLRVPANIVGTVSKPSRNWWQKKSGSIAGDESPGTAGINQIREKSRS